MRDPIKADLRPAFDDERKARIWRKVRARTALAGAKPSRRWAVALAAALVLLATGVIAAPWRSWLAPPAPVAPPPAAPLGAASSVSALASAGFAPAPIAASASAAPSASASSLGASGAPPGAAASAATPSSAPAWRTLEAEGAHARAYDALGDGGIATATTKASLDDLFALADVARLSGHPTEAVAPLERVVREFPDDARSSLAAFTLGRLYLGPMKEPANAAWAFQRAIERGVPGGLEEDAWAALVEARARAGDRAGARDAYQKGMARFPATTHEAEMKRWLESD